VDAAYDEADVSDKPAFIQAATRLRPGQHARILRNFRARRESLLAVDEAVAAIVGALRETGVLDETYVLFTADNGFFHGEHRVPNGKVLAYEPSSHVPLLVRGPGIRAGGTSAELVGNVDLAPTILAAAGARATKPQDGRSLLPFARNPRRRTDRPLLHEALSAARQYVAVRTPRWLYIEHATGERELYDRVRDPAELRSLHRTKRHARVRAELRSQLRALRGCRGSACSRPRPLRVR